MGVLLIFKLIFQKNHRYLAFYAGLELGNKPFQVGDGVDAVIIDGMSLRRQFSGLIPITQSHRAHFQKIRRLSYCEKPFIHRYWIIRPMYI